LVEGSDWLRLCNHLGRQGSHMVEDGGATLLDLFHLILLHRDNYLMGWRRVRGGLHHHHGGVPSHVDVVMVLIYWKI
jgi:hypothetical protein